MALALVALVYKTGPDFNPKYVRRLVASLREHGAQDIVCLSDDPSVSAWCDYRRLKHGYYGWWSKLELFYLKEKTVYFDLDTVISKDITPLLEYPHEFTMLRGFRSGRGASGVLGWNGDFSYLMDKFTPKRIPEYMIRGKKWGDQDWINDHLKHKTEFFQELFPGMVVSHKDAPIEDRQKASVICYHGRPRPHETGWSI